MSIGMTYDQYWYGDVRMTEHFLRAEIERKKRVNNDAHLVGMYVYEALCDASPLFRDLVKKHKPVPFRAEPFPLYERAEEKNAEDAERERKNEQLKAQLFFKNWARAAGKKFQ